VKNSHGYQQLDVSRGQTRQPHHYRRTACKGVGPTLGRRDATNLGGGESLEAEAEFFKVTVQVKII
jgi:hypothetical protein